MNNSSNIIQSYKKNKPIRFIDLFAGMGGTRIGFEQSLKENDMYGECVFTSEIKSHAISIYRENFGHDFIHGDITKINARKIPDFDYLLAGFPCQPFSSTGKKLGFLDKRGGMFFTILKIINEKNPREFFWKM